MIKASKEVKGFSEENSDDNTILQTRRHCDYKTPNGCPVIKLASMKSHLLSGGGFSFLYFLPPRFVDNAHPITTVQDVEVNEVFIGFSMDC